MTSANLVPCSATSTMTLLADLAYALTKERTDIHFVCSLDGSSVSAFTSREKALAEWEQLCKKHKGKYRISSGTPLEADGASTVALRTA
jgi:hypothetical protein